ncbi:LysR family transcriptional regulator [Flavobacterium magnum]|uniref:LysR family transcriptional regulator n=1 Tax=Flavobacterium magnum TaxID=2162713 RepID=A0A2S0RFL5_9FLAO|nr:LysR family transcriptional regulator [Flavobacterium magnum]AWA30319.1 LysR family transcriptional regulator [Flavobacterium magnum]
MNYTLHQLQVFLKVTQTLSITKAAEELHLTQPAVSIQLRNFQDQFDIPLTEIVGRQLFVTDFGKEIATAAEKIINEVHAINYKTLAHKGQLSGRLKISVVSTGKYVMPYFLADFLKRHEGVELLLDVTNKARVIDSLAANDTDFALVSVLPAKLDILKVELMENRLFLISDAKMRPAKQPAEKSILETLPLIYREQGSGTRYVMEQFLKGANLNVVKKMELSTNEAVKQAVIAGLGCSIMPIIGIKNELASGDLQIVPVKGLPIKSNWNLIWLRSKNLSPVAEAFLKYINDEKSTIIDEWFDWAL